MHTCHSTKKSLIRCCRSKCSSKWKALTSTLMTIPSTFTTIPNSPKTCDMTGTSNVLNQCTSRFTSTRSTLCPIAQTTKSSYTSMKKKSTAKASNNTSRMTSNRGRPAPRDLLSAHTWSTLQSVKSLSPLNISFSGCSFIRIQGLGFCGYFICLTRLFKR